MKKCFCFAISFLFTLKLFSQPTISSFTPGAGPIGSTITITGLGFSTTTTNDIVYFGPVKATVTAATSTELSVLVPPGAAYQPLSVTTNNLTAYSTLPFIVTYPNGNVPYTSNSFFSKIDLTTGNFPHCVLLGDFTGNGKPDILVSRGSSSVVSIFPNTSSGDNLTFASAIDLPATGNNHEDAAVGDLDGDGKLDFVITNSHNLHSVSVFRNTSLSNILSFDPKIDFPAVNTPYSVEIGDLNNDGKPDMVIANSANDVNSISIYINTSTPGSISFSPKTDFAVGTSPFSIAIGDMDGDGKADIIISTQSTTSAISVMKNTSSIESISFNAPIDYAVIPGPYTVSIGDFNADNKPDLVAASGFSNSVVVLKNTGTMGNLSFSQQSFSVGSTPSCVSVGDLDGDGKPDIVACNKLSHSVSALKNTSSAGNISFANHIDYAVGAYPIYVAIGDLDGDGKPEIISANSSDPTISVLRNIIASTIAPSITSFSPNSGVGGTVITINGTNFTNVTSVKFGGVEATSFTIDSDTRITAIVGTGASGDVSVTTSFGTVTLPGFTFNPPVINSFTPASGITGTVVTITGSYFTGVTEVKFGGTPASSFTVNSPTTITATVGAGSSGSVTVVSPNGTSSLPGFAFTAPSSIPTITSFSPSSGPVGTTVTITGTNFNPVASANTVFFGAVKAVVNSATTTQLNVTVPTGATYHPISVTAQNLTAYSTHPFVITFPSDNPTITTSSFSLIANYSSGSFPSSVSIIDLDLDGKPDIVTANSVSNSISILKNNSSLGTISFNTKVDYASGPDPKRIAIADLDGDGKPDIITSNCNAGTTGSISVFRNTSNSGVISFAPRVDYPSGNGSIGIATADMNKDGKPDIIVASGNSGFFSIFKNITSSPGNISLAAKQDLSLLAHPDNLIVADLDKDGMADVITSNSSNSALSIFRNISSGGDIILAARSDYSTGTFPSNLSSGDLNGDGMLDIMVSNYSSGSVSFFKNNSNQGNIYLEPKQDLNTGVTNFSVNDINGDGRLDLLTGKWLTGEISVLENTYSGSGDFSFAPGIQFNSGNYDTYVTSGDLDGDGKPELVAVNTLPATVSVFKNIISAPAISTLSVTNATNGASVSITGSNFTGATSVKFGGTSANSFTVVSATKIDAVVGGGASGNVSVTTSAGTATITGFSFIPEINFEGSTELCNGSSVILSSTAIANNQWYKNGIAISGATSSNLIVTTGGVYTVKTTSNGITTSSASGITITTTTVPKPTISIDANNNLVSSAATGNQWHLNGSAIIGANQQTYHPAESGTYTVTTTVNNCVSETSVGYNYVVTGVINLPNGQFIKLYPNPVRNELIINWNIAGFQLLNIELIDLQGKQLLSMQNISSGNTINLSEFSPGTYFIRVYSKQLQINKTIKINRQD